MKYKVVYIFLFIINANLFGQSVLSSEQTKLEKQRLKLRKEIKQINSLLFVNKQKKNTTVSDVEDIQLRISVRRELIKVNNEQANFLESLINVNQRDIDKYRSQLTELKKEFALIIQKSYKSKSMQNRLMFIFSSENFVQAYKRIDYLKQYNSYRKKQAIKIKNQTFN